MLQKETVTWSNGKVEVYNEKFDHELFYGFPELGQNLVWKPMMILPFSSIFMRRLVTTIRHTMCSQGMIEQTTRLMND